MSDPIMLWNNKKSLWNKVGKAGSIGIQVIPGTTTRTPILTNGHFAVSVGKGLVKTCEEKAGTTFEKMSGTARKTLPQKLPKTKARAFHRTPILTQTSKELYRVYKEQDGDRLALYSALYVEFLGDPEVVHAVDAEHVAVDDPAAASWWLMPRHLGTEEKAILCRNGSAPKAAPAPTAPRPAPAPKAAPAATPAPADTLPEERAAVDAAEGSTITRSGSWLWARFPARPAAEIREQMKAAGWRWSRRRGEWYLRPVQAAA